MQNVIGYPIITAGWLLASRGVGTLVAMMLVGRLLRLIEARYLILFGLTLTAATLYQMTGFTPNTSKHEIVMCGLLQGFGLGFVFIPLRRSRSSPCRSGCAPTAPRCSRWCAMSRARSASRW